MPGGMRGLYSAAYGVWCRANAHGARYVGRLVKESLWGITGFPERTELCHRAGYRIRVYGGIAAGGQAAQTAPATQTRGAGVVNKGKDVGNRFGNGLLLFERTCARHAG